MTPVHLLSGRLLTRNALWNLAGTGLPLLAALWAIPKLIDGIGVERFGLLTIIWVGIGYASLFDLGIGRAVTKLVAERLGAGRQRELPALVATALRIMFALGILAALLIAACAPWLAEMLHISPPLVSDALHSFWILAAAVPFVISSAGLVGILQAFQMAGRINAVRIPLGIMNFLAPVLAIAVTPSLVSVATALAALRIATWLAYRQLCRSVLVARPSPAAFDRAVVRELLSFGGWITVSNIIGPMMVYFDRFVIGAILTMQQVAYYTTPYEVTNRLLIVPAALSDVLFPAFATALVADIRRAGIIFATAIRASLIIMFPTIAMVVLFGAEALQLWLGRDFAAQSTSVLQWLAIGVFINSSARQPSSVLQAHGFPQLTAMLHVAELPLYIATLWLLTKNFGVTGTAAAWTLRIATDTGALYSIAAVKVPALRYQFVRAAALTAAASALLAALVWPQALTIKFAIGALVAIGGIGLAFLEVLRMRAQETRTVVAQQSNC